MKTYSSALTAYRAAGKAHHQIDFISFKVRGIDDPDALTWCSFCTDEDDMTIEIVDPDTGLTDERTFAGGGHIVGLEDIVRTEGAVIRSHNIVLSGASDTVRDMIYGFNCRGALYQRFQGEVDQDTGLLVDTPPCEFVGFINTIDGADGALPIDGSSPAESLVHVTVDSLAAALTARNFGMRSLENSKARSDDRFLEYGDSVHHWAPRWAKDKKSEKKRRGSRGNGSGGKSGTVGGTGRTRPDRT